MAKAAILGSLLAVIGVLANVIVGAATGFGWMTIRTHFSIAVASTVAILFAWTIVFLYFVGACAWVKEGVDDGGCAPTFLDEAVRIRGQILPWVVAAALLLSAAYIIGGGAHSGAVPWSVHLGLAIVALLAHVVAAYRSTVFVGMMLDVQARMGPVAVAPGE